MRRTQRDTRHSLADRRRQAAKRRQPRIALVSLGCAKNLVDAESALADILSSGFVLTAEPADADLILVNTCAFIAAARQESQEAVAAALALRPPGSRWPAVAAVGCYATRDAAELERLFPALDGIIGLAERDLTAEICRQILAGKRVRHISPPGQAAYGAENCAPRPRLLLTPPSYAYLKISEGCDNRCAYCSIPAIRGALRSRSAEAVVAEAVALERSGVREIVLVAQDTTAYGMDQGSRLALADLLARILRETSVPRLRLLYAHPAHLTDEVISLLAREPRLCHYLDLPIQHVNTRILQTMGRGYDREHLERLLADLGRIEKLTLRTTLLVGFPGETEREFDELLAFVRRGHFHRLGAFGYSREQNTPAAQMEKQLDAGEIERRRAAIFRAQQEATFRWLDSRIGQKTDILLDRCLDDGRWEGRSAAEAPEVDGIIRLPAAEFRQGVLVTACLLKRDGYDMEAIAVESCAKSRFG